MQEYFLNLNSKVKIVSGLQSKIVRPINLVLVCLVFFIIPNFYSLEVLAQNESNKSNKAQTDFQAEVIQVIDGDTIKVRRNGIHKLERVKLIGLDAPEVSSRDHAGQEPYGTMAQQFLSIAITRKIVRIEQDVQLQAETGETLGYVWVGDKMMNEEMLKAGLAVLVTSPPNIKYVERLQKAQALARSQKNAIWESNSSLAQRPSEFRANKRETTTVAAEQKERASELEITDFIEGCVIGNRKTKKYHVPEGHYYNQARESKNRVFFKNAADAEKAGYERAAR